MTINQSFQNWTIITDEPGEELIIEHEDPDTGTKDRMVFSEDAGLGTDLNPNTVNNQRTAAPGNVQSAIDDVNADGGGTVKLVSGATYDPSQIITVKSDVTIDFNGGKIEPSTDQDIFEIHPRGRVYLPEIDLSTNFDNSTPYTSTVFKFDNANGQYFWDGLAVFGGTTVAQHVDGGVSEPQNGNVFEFVLSSDGNPINGIIIQNHTTRKPVEDFQGPGSIGTFAKFDSGTGLTGSPYLTGIQFIGNQWQTCSRGYHFVGENPNSSHLISDLCNASDETDYIYYHDDADSPPSNDFKNSRLASFIFDAVDADAVWQIDTIGPNILIPRQRNITADDIAGSRVGGAYLYDPWVGDTQDGRGNSYDSTSQYEAGSVTASGDGASQTLTFGNIGIDLTGSNPWIQIHPDIVNSDAVQIGDGVTGYPSFEEFDVHFNTAPASGTDNVRIFYFVRDLDSTIG